MANEPTVTRDYIDNFAVKKFVTDGLIDTYFDDIDVNLRTISMVGFTTELITNCTEDAFNTGSVLFRECFPNRAQMEESIYSHAAIFQLDDIFSTAASCRFLLVLEEAAIIKNMMTGTEYNNQYSELATVPASKNMCYFCIDKNTTIYVDDTPFTLDYDIMMTIAKNITEKGDDYIFSARYVTEQYTNSISEVSDPYIKVRRSSDGYIALEVQTHQCQRQTETEVLLTSNEINYPVVDIEYDGKIAGFDILYKSPKSSEYTQMETLIVYSQPIKSAFCYYQLVEDGKLRITFNTKDTYFMPEFNSELKIILYITEGFSGNFDSYTGSNITCVPDNETYAYGNSYLAAAQPVGSSANGQDESGIEALQALTVEGYRTANALTTDNDLQTYFNNYKYRYGDIDILFIKKRDDIYERVFSAFSVIRNSDYIYKTNTLNLYLNLFDMTCTEKDNFILEPGTVFTANTRSGYAEFFRNAAKNEEYKALYDEAVENGEIPYITSDIDVTEIPEYLDRNASFAEYKYRMGYDDKVSVWDLTEDDYKEYDDPSNTKFLLINPFLLRFTKSPNLVTTYMTYVDNAVSVDFTNQNQEMYLQFTMYTFYMSRRFTKDKRYDIRVNIAPSIAMDTNNSLIHIDSKDEETGEILYHLNDKYALDQNDLRVIMVITDGKNKLCYTELIPTNVDQSSGNIQFEGSIFTDDFLSSAGNLRILENSIYRNSTDGSYYKVHDDDKTLYDLYDSDGNVIKTNVSSSEVQHIINGSTDWREWSDVHNMYLYDDCLIPVGECVIKVYTLYNKNYSESAGGLVPILQGNNEFSLYDDTLANYTWTNEYATITEKVTFIETLDSVRTYLDYLDYTSMTSDDEGSLSYAHDIMDVEMKSVSFIRASETLDDDMTDYFFNTFYQNYKFLEEIIDLRLRNETGIDFKFYNTYGRSNNFYIGEDGEIINTVNISITLDIWFVTGTDVITAIPELKRFIKSQIETINTKGMNSLFISNLMRKVEDTYTYVDHIQFKQINHYDCNYQSIRNYVTDLTDLSVEERRWYVPELLVCDIDDIIISDYYV